MKSFFIAAALIAGTPALAQDAMPAAPAASAAPATPTPVDSASLPTCSKKIQDHCINAGAAGAKATGVHKHKKAHHKTVAKKKTTATTATTTTPQ